MRPQLRRFIPARNRRAQAHAAQHVDLEKPQPVGVGDLLERLRLEDAEVVDDDFDVREASRHLVGGRSGRPRSPANVSTVPPACAHGPPLASRTAASVPAVHVTRAPSRSNASAESQRPIPAVLPLTSASLTSVGVQSIQLRRQCASTSPSERPQPSLRGSEPPISTPVAGSMMTAW